MYEYKIIVSHFLTAAFFLCVCVIMWCRIFLLHINKYFWCRYTPRRTLHITQAHLIFMVAGLSLIYCYHIWLKTASSSCWFQCCKFYCTEATRSYCSAVLPGHRYLNWNVVACIGKYWTVKELPKKTRSHTIGYQTIMTSDIRWVMMKVKSYDIYLRASSVKVYLVIFKQFIKKWDIKCGPMCFIYGNITRKYLYVFSPCLNLWPGVCRHMY